jgi:glycosyltransferase involved in cell wall biosynthesis
MFAAQRRFKVFFIFINRILSYGTDFVTFNSHEPLLRLEKSFYKKTTIKFIPNGIEISKNNTLDSKKYYPNHNYLNIIILARLSEVKNHVFLIDTIKNHPLKKQIKIHLVGDGNLKSSLETYINNLSLKDNFIFWGHLPDPTAILEKSDIGVLVSKSEGFSNSILEYMKHGLPVIASNVGSNFLCVTDNGFIISNETELSQSISFYMENPSYLILHGKNSLKNIVKYDINLIAKQYMFLYEK